jgi:hypothetical protein
MFSFESLTLDDLCKFMSSHGATLSVDRPRDADGKKRLHGTQLRLTVNPDGYRSVTVGRLVRDDDLWSTAEEDFFARELGCMVREIEREHPVLQEFPIPVPNAD